MVNIDPVARICGNVGGVAQGYPLGKFPEGMDHLINIVISTNYVSVHGVFTLAGNYGQRMGSSIVLVESATFFS